MVKTSNPSARIINLAASRHPGDGLADDIGKLLQACRSITLKRLGKCFDELFERADDVLFDFGEKAQSNVAQMQFFDDLRELRRKRALVERLFHQGIARAFSEFTSKGPSAPAGKANSTVDLADAELTLVKDEELEESLTFDHMVSKAENRFPQELNALNQRISVLAGGAPVEVENNPAGPAYVCGIFRDTAAEFDMNPHSTLVLYKLFDRFVVNELGGLYDEVNRMLIEAGVLPQLKTSFGATFKDSLAPRGDSVLARTGKRAAGSGNTARDPLASQQRPSSLRDAIRYSSYDEDAPVSSGRSHFYAHLDLINALAILQGDIAGSARQIEPGATGDIKSQLLNQVGKLTDSSRKQGIARRDEHYIDLVGMLFEYILTDRNLPDTIQVLLAQLQIPYLKIALMDDQLFMEREQPARRLLDEMAHEGIGWTPENDKDQVILSKLSGIVNRILNEFDDDPRLFEILLDDFDAFLAHQRRVASATEKRTTEATRGSERLREARKQAARQILQRVENNKLPEAIRELLTRPWANVLVLTQLRHGESSRQWAQALQVADDLIWCIQPKPEEAERMRMVELVFSTQVAVREGLTLVAMHEDEIDATLMQLTECFEAILTDEPLKRETLETSNDAQETPEWLFETGSEAETKVAQESTIEQAEKAQLVEQLQVGAWIEFTEEDGTVQRAKLSWVSPISHRFLLVSPKGMKIADKTLDQLACALRKGTITILDQVPIVDRAMDAIAKKLKEK